MSDGIDHETISRYVNTLYRLGTAEAPYWFVGLEEGGGGVESEISARLKRWAKDGEPSESWLTDMGIPHPDHISKYLPGPDQRANLQKTWSNQIRVVLGIRNDPLSNPVVRRMQEIEHANKISETSLLELYPLPCPSSDKWLYGSLGLGAEFESKSEYYKRLLSPRLDVIFKSITSHQPKSVVFMTWAQRDAIALRVPTIAPRHIGSGKTPGKAMIGRLNNTIVVICSHPANWFSNKSQFFWELGRAISNEMETLQNQTP